MVGCPSCGTANLAGHRFCVRCGKPLPAGASAIERYHLEGVLGRGASSIVYRATDTVTGQVVAVKALSPELAGRPESRQRLRAEADVLMRLSHPNIASVVDLVETDDAVWLVTEALPGTSLRNVLIHARKLEPEQALSVFTGLLAGLAYAHQRGLVHGDLKPENVLVEASGTARLVDFGQSVPAGHATAGGTAAYMSPEAVRGEAVGPAADLYSAGAVLYEALTGQPPFLAASQQALLQLQLTATPKPIADLPPAIGSLVAALLEKDPARRPADATAALSAFDAAVRDAYGSEWRRRAGVADLVETTATHFPTLPDAPVSGGEPQPPHGAGVVPPVGAPDHAPAIGPQPATPRHAPRRRWLVVALAALVAVAGTTAGVVVATAGGTPAAGPTASTPASTPTSLAASRGTASQSTTPAAGGAAAPASAVIGQVAAGTGPDFAAVDPVLNRLYVANAGNFGNTVSVIDTATDQVVATVQVATGPDGIAVDPVSHDVYVSNGGAGGTGDTVSVIDGRTDKVIDTIRVGGGPRGIAVDANLVYVADGGGDGGSFATSPPGDTVTVINASTNRVTGSVHVGLGPLSVAVDPVTDTVYTANADNGTGNTVSVIDGQTQKVTATIGVGGGPTSVAVDPATGQVFTANAGFGCPGGPSCGSTVTVINGHTDRVQATVPVGMGPAQVAVDSTTGTAYVTTSVENTLTLLNISAAKVSGTVSVGTAPDAVTVDTSTHRVYVADSYGADDGTVFVLAAPAATQGSSHHQVSASDRITSPPAGGTLNNTQGIEPAPVTCGFKANANPPFSFATGLTGTAEPAISMSLPTGASGYFYVGSDAGGNPLTRISWHQDLSVIAGYSGNQSISIGHSGAATGSYFSGTTTNVAIAGLAVRGYSVTGRPVRVSTSSGTSVSLTVSTGQGDLVLVLVGGQGAGLVQETGAPLSTLVNVTYSECGSNVIASASMFAAFLPAGSHQVNLTGTTFGTNSGAAVGAVAYVLARS